ncbi:hypothetical protein P872_07475 [Rhodonellum psychrophilum GCM71 = DSM 17998]|uniref:site-specific DNA-methyltransferase (adenine-specific) n=2 Tax=Rhodonellum TaxID=336827 RepID=U5C1E9_9BACT|nr:MULTISPECIES: Eco57I restriction-modification methylase domain-containing protein [Rhodonellum]ERM81987.1 hypothetical protein P872_07475 [Rhodonellum psychrophilum GCM71 = DSM 17998]SDZ31813.1 Type II restriction/modification system, DNA methylase subunit YeeA [Rhodonellum ikkaensis]
MKINRLKPRKALNKAFLKVKPNRTDIERFKTNLIQLLDRTNDTESEEFHKNLVIDFLKKTYYEPNHYINTKGRNDLVIHNGDKSSSPVAVIIETKKPTNKTEMPQVSNGAEKLNTKAFQELVLYYLRERITHKNLEVRQLVITNINEWFIFDATTFDRLFAQNKNLVKQFQDFEGGRLADTKTDFFYRQIAEPFIAALEPEIEFTYFNLQDYQKPLRNADKADDNILIALFKLLSPEHLLKLPFTNDSNSLDKRFYSEFLHIIGLTETKEGGKKLINRNKEGERNTGSILEDAIIQLDSMDKISRLERPSQFGNTQQERLFTVALELTITWINRILFLKLLEAQLLTYHRGDTAYAFLNLDKIKSYDDLNGLFFQVLARRYPERNEDVKKAFDKVPYLNSSLFEPTEIEHSTLFISNLRDDKKIPIFSQTVLKDDKGKKLSGEMPTLEYLFRFLEAYDFGAEGGEDIQEDNKTLINASVLGLIFEKINGYKEGSIFTPGFVTMYMSGETIRKAVVQKFNEAKGWNCKSFEELKEDIQEEIKAGNRKEVRKSANQIINSLKIIDPAVGSGHFLVSVLNELLAIKSELKVLVDAHYEPLSSYTVEVVNDELIVTDEEGILYQYNPKSKESQRIQETLFHEKQILIESCLFGVDINPNSVKICRLRLWIELLKSAYYKQQDEDLQGFSRELETLPNIDINIKCGNSLVSRFAIDADLKQALKKSKWSIDSYRIAVATYRNAKTKEEKREMERLIADIKSDFRSEIAKNDPKIKRKAQLAGELYNLTMQQGLFEESPKLKKERLAKAAKLEANLNQLETEIEEIKGNKIFENAFEWRFEFPEVLNEEGDFVGFDVVIGNPPYMRIQELNEYAETYKSIFKCAKTGNYDIYVLFIEKSVQLLNASGNLQFILPHKFLIADFGKGIRDILYNSKNASEIIHFGHEMIFEGVTTYTCLLSLNNKINSELKFIEIDSSQLTDKKDFINLSYENIPGSEPWLFMKNESLSVMDRLTNLPLKIGDVLDKVFSGIQTSADKIYSIIGGENNGFVIGKSKNGDENVSVELGLVKPLIKGEDIKRYSTIHSDTYVIFPYLLVEGEANPMSEEYIREKFPVGYNYLKKYESNLRGREKGKMDFADKWFLYNYPKNLVLANQNKLVSPDITFGMNITKESGNFCVKNGAYGITIKLKYKKYENEIIAILNSKLLWYYIQNTGNVLRGGYFRFNTKYILPFPLPDFTKANTSILSKLVNKTFEAKQKGLGSREYENQIDQLVYALYELTEEEIAIVEGSSK